MDFADIKDLINDFNTSKLTKLEIEIDGSKVRLEKQTIPPEIVAATYRNLEAAAMSYDAAGIIQAAAPPAVETASAPAPEGHAVTAPIVGTFYSSSSPEKPAFVQAGDYVKPGDVLCIIEAMKIMNEIPCDRAGKVAEVCVKDGAMVEFGQTLFRIV